MFSYRRIFFALTLLTPLLTSSHLTLAQEVAADVQQLESRLLQITREYRKFSQTDEVLFLLGEIYLRTEQVEDGRNYFWQLVCQHPNSKHVNDAFARLSQIGFDSTKDCDNLQR